jgi:hypothetical protein
MSLLSDQELFSQNVATLIIYIFGKGYKCTFGEAWRSHEQAVIYAKSGKGIVDSQHCKRLAIDLNLISPKGELLTNSADYELFGVFWEKLCKNNEWGGRWKHRIDGNHFQMNETKT